MCGRVSGNCVTDRWRDEWMDGKTRGGTIGRLYI